MGCVLGAKSMEFSDIQELFESYLLEATLLLEGMPELTFFLKSGVIFAFILVIAVVAFTAIFG